MKRLSFLFIIITLLCSFAGKKKKPYSDSEIKGPVKCVKTYTYKNRSGTGLRDWNEVCYDKMGNICRARHYEGRNVLITNDTTAISYNGNGNIDHTLYHLSAYRDTLRTNYKYDQGGILIQKDASWKRGNAPRSEKFFYDKAGNLATILTIEPDGSQSNRATYTYNAQGLLIRLVKTSKIHGGVTEARTSWQYDGNHNLVQKDDSSLYGEDAPTHIGSINTRGYPSGYDKYGNYTKMTLIDFSSGSDTSFVKRKISYY